MRGLLAGILMTAGTASADEPPTFNRDIAPIVFANCAPCHRPGEAGPFSLLSYADVKSRARLVAAVTGDRYMPPWPPEAGKGSFVGERRLTDTQIALIRRWVDAGAAEGDPALRPSPPTFTEGWQLGEPDLVLKLPRPFLLQAEGTDVFWNLLYPSPVTGTRYVKAVEIRLPDRKVGHHANLLLDRSHTSRALDGRSGALGFPGMDLAFESEGFDPDSHFLFWKPGTVAREEPRGMAWRLDRRTDLVLNLHLRPSGKRESVTPQVGLYFTDEVPSLRPMLVQLEHDGAIDLVPGAKDVVVTDELVLPVAVDVLAVYPHAHYLGHDVQGEVELPDGTRQWLIHIEDWDVNWQAVYRLAEPLSLPAGTKITMRWTYDNTRDNVRNPSSPPVRVRAGNRAQDEMAHLWLQVLPRGETAGPDPRLVLQEALMRRRLAKYPRDFTAHYNLGAALQAQGRGEEAVRALEEAVRLDPRKATARTTLGATLQSLGRTQAALREYREAVRLDPTYVSAQFDLGQALLVGGRLKDALVPLREAARLEPEDAEIQAQLGVALQKAAQPQAAVVHYRRALTLDPEHANARDNLAQALAQQGEWAEAADQYREAVRRRPEDAGARAGLGVALLAQGQVREARNELEAALRMKPDDLTAHDVLGQLLLAEGESAEAASHLRLVTAGRPDDADVWSNLGSALAMGGHLAEAVKSFERALQIDPQHAAARANLERARGLADPP